MFENALYICWCHLTKKLTSAKNNEGHTLNNSSSILSTTAVTWYFERRTRFYHSLREERKKIHSPSMASVFYFLFFFFSSSAVSLFLVLCLFDSVFSLLLFVVVYFSFSVVRINPFQSIPSQFLLTNEDYMLLLLLLSIYLSPTFHIHSRSPANEEKNSSFYLSLWNLYII